MPVQNAFPGRDRMHSPKDIVAQRYDVFVFLDYKSLVKQVRSKIGLELFVFDGGFT